MNLPQDIFQWIKQEETEAETEQIQVGSNWNWNFREHVQLIFHLKNGVFYTGSSELGAREQGMLRTFKNIMEPILNLAYWTEDIEVKDVVFYIENEVGRVLSFLIKKYHDEVYVKEHDLDTLFDEITESDLDYGGVLVQDGLERPEVLPLNSVAFCDQTDILGGPVAFKYYFSPEKLKTMSKYGWGEESNGADITLEDLCYLASDTKDAIGTQNDNQNKVPAKTVEVYVIKGGLPESYLKEGGDEESYVGQVQIVAFYTNEESNKVGVTLYKKEDDDSLKFFTSKKVFQRALGRGVGESLLHPQIWTNLLSIYKTSMLESGSKTPLVTDDENFINKNKVQDMENLEVTTIGEGKSINLINTINTANVQLFEKSIDEWYQQAQFAGSAFDSVLGKEESSGTTFRGQERLVQQGRGIHDRRRGQRAKFIEEIYRDWIIPKIVKDITKGKEFLATLSADELTWVADQLATNETNNKLKDMILESNYVDNTMRDVYTQNFKQDFFKKGNKHLLEALKGEFKDVEVKMGINIANKQRNLGMMSDKLLSMLEVGMANPQFKANLEANGMIGAFNDLLEYSGISPTTFSQAASTPVMQNQQIAGQLLPKQAVTSI